MADPKQDVQDVRAQFEAWARTAGMNTRRTDSGLCYVSDYTDDAWEGYQAALQSPAVRELVEALESAVPDLEYAVALAGAVNEFRANAISIRLCSVRAALRTLGAGHVE